jgi:hypothetical protein
MGDRRKRTRGCGPYRIDLTSCNRPGARDQLPDVRDGLTRRERIVLSVLHDVQRERGDHNVPTPLLWGRVCEYFYISPEELSEMLARLGGRRD